MRGVSRTATQRHTNDMTPASPAAVSVTGLMVRLGGRTLVHDFAMTVPVGAIYGFLGPNGAGKTTTLRTILGLISPTRGDVRLLGESVAHDRRCMERQLRHVGALIEAPAFYPHMSGMENARAMCMLRGIPMARAARRLTDVGLMDAADRPASTYSLGMKQRLAFALALMADPALLVLDEPANGLDPEGMMQAREMLLRLNRVEGITILMSSHLLSDVEAIATHIGIMREGRMVHESDMATVRQRYGALLIRVDDAAAARALLTERYPSATLTTLDDGSLVQLTGVPPDQAGQINQILSTSGIVVSHLSVTSATLEQVFLSLAGQ